METKATFKKVSNGYFNVYISGENIGRIRFATLGTRNDAETLRDAINNGCINEKKLMKRIMFGAEGMIPRRILRLADVYNLVFMPYLTTDLSNE